jgi:hypothetical protein
MKSEGQFWSVQVGDAPELAGKAQSTTPLAMTVSGHTRRSEMDRWVLCCCMGIYSLDERKNGLLGLAQGLFEGYPKLVKS